MTNSEFCLKMATWWRHIAAVRGPFRRGKDTLHPRREMRYWAQEWRRQAAQKTGSDPIYGVRNQEVHETTEAAAVRLRQASVHRSAGERTE